jgi:hypothetical protein
MGINEVWNTVYPVASIGCAASSGTFKSLAFNNDNPRLFVSMKTAPSCRFCHLTMLLTNCGRMLVI